MGEHRALERMVRRREALLGLGGLSAAALLDVVPGSGTAAEAASAQAAAVACVLSPEVTEGPYWIANHLTRRDITEGKHGLPLALHITVVRANTCTAIANADVEVWHADPSGTYSGYGGSVTSSGPGGHATPNNSKRFLRGHQKSDVAGTVLFDTIYPGWYRGRTTHVHMKVHVGGSVVHTGQLFFADSVSDAVYRSGAYRAHGQPDTTNAADTIYAAAGGSRAQLSLRRRKGHRGYSAKITVAVAS